MQRRVVPLVIGGFVGTAILVWALSQRDRAQSSLLPDKPVPVKGDTQPLVNKEALQALAGKLPGTKKTRLREEIRGLLQEAAQAYRERKAKEVQELLTRITDHGSVIQRILAERILETGDRDEQLIGTVALEKVSTKEVAPFALALVQSSLPDEVKSIAVKLLTRYEVASAAGPVENLLFGRKISTGLQKQGVLYFARIEKEPTLARAAVEPSLEKAIRALAARSLANLGTEEAARLLLEAWKNTFIPNTRQAQNNSYLLKALASMESEILRTVVLAYLETETDLSRKNFIFAMISGADRNFALETLRNALDKETAPQVRTQVIAALGALGGEEVQKILLGLLETGNPDEVLASLNALLIQSKMEVPFDDLVGLFENETDPVHRTVLGSLLSKYGDALSGKPELAKHLLQEATAGMDSSDPAVRGLSINLCAALAKYSADPAGNLIGIYSDLTVKEQAAHPVLFQEITKMTGDVRAKEIVVETLKKDSSAVTIRWQAANALFNTGDTEPVYQAIASEKSPEMMDAFVGIALANGGDEATKELSKIAGGMKDSLARNVLLERLKVWTTKDEFQLN